MATAYDVYQGRAMEGMANNGQRLVRTPTGQIIRYSPAGPIVEQPEVPRGAPMFGAMAAGSQPEAQPMQMAQDAPARPRPAGGFLERIFNPQGSAKNQTIQFLTQQGMDEGTATLMAGNKPVLQQYLLQQSQGADPMDALKLEKTQLEIDQMRNPTTDDVREYEFARQQGYEGSFTDFMTEMRKAGASSVTVGGQQDPMWGDAPTDQVWLRDESGEVVTEPDSSGRGVRPVSVPISGSKADIEAEQAAQEAETKQGVQAATDLGKADTMLDATSNIKKLMEEADTPVTGTLSRPFAMYSGSAAGKVRSYVGALKSGVALNAIMRLKEASAQGATGFGAMNEKELQLLIDDVGALDADTTDPEIFAKTVDRIENRFKRVIEDVKRNVDPERIKELGLGPLIASIESGDGRTEAAPGVLPSPPGENQVNPSRLMQPDLMTKPNLTIPPGKSPPDSSVMDWRDWLAPGRKQ